MRLAGFLSSVDDHPPLIPRKHHIQECKSLPKRGGEWQRQKGRVQSHGEGGSSLLVSRVMVFPIKQI